MWKNGKEGRRIMEGTEGRWWERKKKRSQGKGGCGRRGKGSGERQERRRENKVGGNKIIAAWLRRCGIK